MYELVIHSKNKTTWTTKKLGLSYINILGTLAAWKALLQEDAAPVITPMSAAVLVQFDMGD